MQWRGNPQTAIDEFIKPKFKLLNNPYSLYLIAFTYGKLTYASYILSLAILAMVLVFNLIGLLIHNHY